MIISGTSSPAQTVQNMSGNPRSDFLMRLIMQKLKTTVSVIIPLYNTELYLRECLDSVINQTLRDIEIICINDGSTDSLLTILDAYQEADSHIIVLDQGSKGPSTAQSRGLQIARRDRRYRKS